MSATTHMRLVRRGWAAAIAAGLFLCGGTAAAATLSVCIDRSSSMRNIDTALAQAIAKQQGATLRIHEYNSRNNDDVNGMADFDKLVRHACDLVLGFPLDTDAPPNALGDLDATRPYAHTGFVLLVPRSSKATTLGELPDGSRVAVTYMTPPNLYFATHPGLQKVVELHDPATLDAVATGKVAAALVWSPALAGYLASHPDARDLVSHTLVEPHATFNLVALYAPDHAAEAAAFDAAVAKMHASGALRKILGRYAAAGAAPAGRAADNAPADPPLDPPPTAAAGEATGQPAPAAKPALYTAQQAAAGKREFLANCAMCHGPLLEGMAGPALKGRHFAPASFDYHVSDIFGVVANNMPADQPGSLKHETYVEIMAFLLQQNGYPAGTQALTYDGALQSKVSFVSEGK